MRQSIARNANAITGQLRAPRRESVVNFICLSDRLRYQSVIRKRLGLDGPAGQIVEELVFDPASIEAIDEFLEVTIEILVTDAVEGPDQPGLEVGDDRVSLGQNFTGGFRRGELRGLVVVKDRSTSTATPTEYRSGA